jgi:hypothetical protein
MRVMPVSATITLKCAVQDRLQLKCTMRSCASAVGSEPWCPIENANRGAPGARAPVVNVRSAPTTVPPALEATSR